MNTYKELLPRTILLGSMGLAAMLFVSTPQCKAQEVSPDHFTDTGVQNVYEAAPAQAATQTTNQAPATSGTHTRQGNLSTTRRNVAKRTPILSAKLDAPQVADKRKSVASTTQKQ